MFMLFSKNIKCFDVNIIYISCPLTVYSFYDNRYEDWVPSAFSKCGIITIFQAH